MNLTTALTHKDHRCDVWAESANSDSVDHFGVIEKIDLTGKAALVSGHFYYPTKWVLIESLQTGCQVQD